MDHRLRSTGDFHGFNGIRHVEFRKFWHALSGGKGIFRARKVFIINLHGRIGTHNHAFNVIAPIPPIDIFQGGVICGSLDLDMRIVLIIFVVIENLDPTIRILL